MRVRPIESDILKAAGYSILLAIGIAGTFILYGSLMTSAQVLAVETGSTPEEVATIGIWATCAVLFLGTAPMLRFIVAELPDRLAEALRLPPLKMRWLCLFGLGLVLLFAV
jgi:hypothetical protein